MEIQSKTIPKKVAYEPAPEDIEPTGLRYEEIKPLAIEGNIRDMVSRGLLLRLQNSYVFLLIHQVS